MDELKAYRRMGVEADAVLRLGMLLMGAGTSGYRVMRGMKRAARVLGFDSLDIVVGVTQITCTFHRGGAFRTVVARQHSPAVDASRIEALEDLTHHLPSTLTAEGLNSALDSIEAGVKKRWSGWMLALAAAVACAAFAVLNSFSPVTVALVAVAAFSGQFVRHLLGHQHVQQVGGVVAAGLMASLVYAGATYGLAALGLGNPSEFASGYVAAVLFLIPGFPLFSALIDLARFDFEAGLTRLAYALTVIVAATLTVSMVSWVAALDPVPVAQAATPAWFAAAGVASFVGVAGFALLFNSSRRMALVAATVGALANLVRLGLVELGATAYLAALIGGLIVGLFGAVASRRAGLPRITTTVPAAVIMIPGTSMFRAVYQLNAGDMAQTINYSASAMLSVVSIGAGLVLARLLTDKDWTLGHLIQMRGT